VKGEEYLTHPQSWHGPWRILAFAIALLYPAMAVNGAEAPQITGVRVGLPGGTKTNRSRNGAWAPVYLALNAGKEGCPQGAWSLVIESADSEEVPYRVTTAVPALGPGEKRVVQAYVRPGADNSEFSSKLLSSDGRVVQSLPRVRREAGGLNREIIDPNDILYLTLGSRLPGLRRAVQPALNPEADDEDRGSAGFAAIEDPALLPDRWYGYEAADLIVLATGSDAFVSRLLEEGEQARRDALLDWVRRGGRLVISVGRNHQLVARLLEKMPLLDCGIKGAVTRPALPSTLLWIAREAQHQQLQKPLRSVEIACVKPGASVHADVTEEPDAVDLDARPVVIQASCGLGRVLLVAFDLDAPPFTTWEGQAALWKTIQSELAVGQAVQAPGRTRGELAFDLQSALETFGDIPTISFGWVALFLLAYIALVGPVDYFLLKKVFKRLELTWITFPIVVLAVSAVAYLTAYSLKGDELWTNKVDLVEIDLHAPRQVYGTTWFAIFNPRGQAFTLGLEPSSPTWCGPLPAGTTAANVVAPMDGIIKTVGSPGLFRRPYEYSDDGGLRNVPVPVWATRAFNASWRAPLGDVPPVEADIHLARDGTALTGSLINHLPVEMQGAALFYRGEWFALGTLLPEQRLEVQSLFERGVAKKQLPEWFSDSSWAPQAPVAATDHKIHPQILAAQFSHKTIKPLMFFKNSGVKEESNSGLRTLDQSWRLSPLPTVPTPPQQQYRDEVMLVGRAPSLTGNAEALTAGGGSPSRLWMGTLPGRGSPRPPLSGFLSQETYVRVYIPVRK
jgi:hypothetical protein